MTLDDLLRTPYRRDARGPDALDCWGMVRLARVHLFQREELPMFNSVASGDVRSMTRAAVQAARALPECEPHPGAIVTAWVGRTCPHVGILVMHDGLLQVLDTDINTGPKITRLRAFQSKFTRLSYHDN